MKKIEFNFDLNAREIKTETVNESGTVIIITYITLNDFNEW